MGHLLGHGSGSVSPRRDGCRRRRSRPSLSAARHHPDPADGRRTLRQSPRRHPVPVGTAPSLRRPRLRSGRRRGGFDPERPRGSGRDRGADALPGAGRSTRICSASRRRTSGGITCPSSHRRTWPASWTARRPGRDDDVPGSAHRRSHPDRDDALRVGGPRPGLPEAIGRQAARPGNGRWPAIFPSAGKPAFYIARQNSRPPPSSCASAAVAALHGSAESRSARRLVIATKAAMGAADPTRKTSP